MADKKSRGLGRGLSALMADVAPKAEGPVSSADVSGSDRSVPIELVFQTIIPRNVRVSEAPSFAMPVISYDSVSKGASAYRALAKELLGISKPAPAAA